MCNMEIKRYESNDARLWDEFVERSRQGTFLFKRGYMDYHSDRFEDFSLLAVENGRIKALLPANVVGDKLYSHRGLTYGGWLTPVAGFDAVSMLGIWDAMCCFLKRSGIKELHYKCVPWIYAVCPAEEDRYAIFRSGGRLETCQVSSVVDLSSPLGFDSNARRNAAKARRLGLVVGESEDYAGFWEVLSVLLRERYGVHPVHSLDEMFLLAGRFPDNIRLYTVRAPGGSIEAGVVMYLTGRVAHAQYIAASPEGKLHGALPMLFEYLFEEYGECRYFDFGTSCEQGGAYLNAGLLHQKSGFGGRAVNYDAYVVDL